MLWLLFCLRLQAPFVSRNLGMRPLRGFGRRDLNLRNTLRFFRFPHLAGQVLQLLLGLQSQGGVVNAGFVARHCTVSDNLLCKDLFSRWYAEIMSKKLQFSMRSKPKRIWAELLSRAPIGSLLLSTGGWSKSTKAVTASFMVIKVSLGISGCCWDVLLGQSNLSRSLRAGWPLWRLLPWDHRKWQALVC
jgi:hypothetical protein